MKSIVACLIIYFASIGIQTIDKSKTSLVLENLQGKVKSYTEYRYNAEDSAGVVLRRDTIAKETHYFNVEGNRVSSETYYVERKNTEIGTYEYDKNNNQVYFVIQNKEDGSVIESSTMTYNERNDLISYYYFGMSTEQRVRNEYDYDSSGKIVIMKNYKSTKEELYCYYKYTYDQNNKLTSREEYGADSLLDEIITYDSFGREDKKEFYYNGKCASGVRDSYDSKGNLTAFSYYLPDGTITYTNQYRYVKYDAKGNWSRMLELRGDKDKYIYERFYVYY